MGFTVICFFTKCLLILIHCIVYKLSHDRVHQREYNCLVSKSASFHLQHSLAVSTTGHTQPCHHIRSSYLLIVICFCKKCQLILIHCPKLAYTMSRDPGCTDPSTTVYSQLSYSLHISAKSREITKREIKPSPSGYTQPGQLVL